MCRLLCEWVGEFSISEVSNGYFVFWVTVLLKGKVYNENQQHTACLSKAHHHPLGTAKQLSQDEVQIAVTELKVSMFSC